MPLSKHNEKMKLMRVLFTLLRNVLLENAIQNSFIHKNTFSCEKVLSFFWIDFTSVLSIRQKSEVANKPITILGFTNDENIYTAKNIIFID